MLLRWIICCSLVAVFGPGWTNAQSGSKSSEPAEPYRLHLSVDEVVLTFNAEDALGLPINDLEAGEIRLWDDGRAPRRVVAFDQLVNRSIRVGILLDRSESMEPASKGSQAIAEMFVERLFRQKSDEAFVAEFGYTSNLIQPWSGDVSLLINGVQRARDRRDGPGGTALFNAVFRACSSSFGRVDPTVTGNFILLFSDGEDNAGLTPADEAARACQRVNTQVFAFVPPSAEQHDSTGPKALRDLASKTGGRVFVADDSEDAIWRDLKAIESEMRNQYRLIYNPANLKHDGAFHEIVLQPPDRVNRIQVRTGYFAPLR